MTDTLKRKKRRFPATLKTNELAKRYSNTGLYYMSPLYFLLHRLQIINNSTFNEGFHGHPI